MDIRLKRGDSVQVLSNTTPGKHYVVALAVRREEQFEELELQCTCTGWHHRRRCTHTADVAANLLCPACGSHMSQEVHPDGSQCVMCDACEETVTFVRETRR